MRKKNIQKHQIDTLNHGYLHKHSWDNTHQDLVELHKEELYTFYSDIYIEEPFFEEIKSKYKAKEYKHKVFGKKAFKGICPACGKKSGFFTTTSAGNTFRVLCADNDCKFPNNKNAMLLHDIIKEYGGKILYEKWREARYIKKQPYGWYGIKPENRRKSKTL